MEKTLLLVDDEVAVLNALKRVFRREGYTVFTAESGAEALTVLAQQPICVMLSDFRMPGMTGDQLLQEAKRHYPETVRMILSGHADMDAIVSSLNDGAIFKFLAKPWENKVLLSQVGEAFEYWQQMQDQLALSRLAQGAEEALFDLDKEGRVIHLTASAARRCGWQREQARGALLTDLLPSMSELELVLLLHPDGSRLSLRNVQGRLIELHSTRIDSGHWTVKLSPEVSSEAESLYPLGVEGLLDESGLEETLQQLTASPSFSSFALVCLNIDHFTELTERLGARDIDSLRFQVAQMLMLWRRSGGSVAWLGHDEFVLLQPGLRSDQDIRNLVAEQLAPFSAPLQVEGQTHSITFNVGYAVYPDDALDVPTLRQYARLALEHSRHRGHQYYSRYQHRMALDDQAQREMVDDLYYALERNELVVFFRPHIHLLTGNIVYAEACLGWRHERFGLIEPAQLHPIINQCALTEPLLEWLQAMVMAQSEVWAIEGLPVFTIEPMLGSEDVEMDLADCLQSCRRLISPRAELLVRLSEAFLLMDLEASQHLLGELRSTWRLLIEPVKQDALLYNTVRHGERLWREQSLLPGLEARQQLNQLNELIQQIRLPEEERPDATELHSRDLNSDNKHQLIFTAPAVTADRLRVLLEQQPLLGCNIVLRKGQALAETEWS